MSGKGRNPTIKPSPIPPSFETYLENLSQYGGGLTPVELVRMSEQGRNGGKRSAMMGPKRRADALLRKF